MNKIATIDFRKAEREHLRRLHIEQLKDIAMQHLTYGCLAFILFLVFFGAVLWK